MHSGGAEGKKGTANERELLSGQWQINLHPQSVSQGEQWLIPYADFLITTRKEVQSHQLLGLIKLHKNHWALMKQTDQKPTAGPASYKNNQ